MPTDQDAPHSWEFIEDVVVSMTVEGSEITDELWSAFFSEVKASNVRVMMALVVGNVSISSQQRKLAADVMNSKKLGAIVITDSRITRGVLTALSWLGSDVQGFRWSDIDTAVKKVSDATSTQDRLRNICVSFHSKHSNR